MQEAEFIGRFDITDEMVESLQGVPKAYIAAIRGLNDHTVDVLAACTHLRSGLKNDIRLYQLDGIGHASASYQPEIYGHTAIQIRKDLHLPVLAAA